MPPDKDGDKPMNATGIVREIARMRKDRGMTQSELGRAAGLCQPVISRVEKGRAEPNVETLTAMLAPFGKTLIIADIN